MMRLTFTAALLVSVAAPSLLGQSAQVVTLKDVTPRGRSGANVTLRLPSMTVITIPAADIKGNALHATVTEPTCVDAARITLASGTRVIVPLADIDGGEQIARSAECGSTGMASAAPIQSGSFVGPAATDTMIRTKCARDWPDDFRMRAACETQQKDARSTLAVRQMSSGDRLTIRTKCERDWQDDYRMRNACEEQQLKALEQLGR